MSTEPKRDSSLELAEAERWLQAKVDFAARAGLQFDEATLIAGELSRLRATVARLEADPCDHMRGVPAGTKVCYLHNGRILVLGTPAEGDDHNCDAMGCGSAQEHVVRIIDVAEWNSLRSTVARLEEDNARLSACLSSAKATLPREYLRRVTPEALMKCVKAAGWKVAQQRAGVWVMWHSEYGEVLLPLHNEWKDYVARVADAIEAVAVSAKRPAHEILFGILQPEAELASAKGAT